MSSPENDKPGADEPSEDAETPAAGTSAVEAPPPDAPVGAPDLGGIGRKYTKIAGYAGFFVLFFGVLIALTRGAWTDGLALAVFGVGGVALLMGIGTNFEAFADAVISRKTFVGANVIVALACALLLLVIFNFVSYHRYFRVDLTTAQEMAPDSRTKKWLEELEKEVEIWVLIAERRPPQPDLVGHTERVLEELAAIQPLLKVEYVDPILQRRLAMDLAKKIGVERLEEGMILRYGDKIKQLPVQELIKIDAPPSFMMQQAEPKVTYKVEDAVGTAIRGFVQGRDKVIYWTTGHGELQIDDDAQRDPGRSLSHIKDEFKRLGIMAKKIDLTQASKIPEDCQVLVVAGARRKFLPGEISMIEGYVDSDRGHLIYCGETTLFDRRGARADVTGLEPMLERWGVKVRADAVTIQLVKIVTMIMPRDPIVASPQDMHPVSAPRVGYAAMFSDPPVLEETTPENKDYRTFRLLEVSNSYGETNSDMDKLSYDRGVDIAGPVAIGYAVGKRDAPGVDQEKGTKIVVFADTDVCSNFGLDAPANYDLFLNAVNWMSGRESSIGARHRETEKRQVMATGNQGRWLGVGLIVIVPLVVLLCGGVVLLWRRR